MITILKGGTSAEREVSLWTAATIADAIASLKLPFQEVDAADSDWLNQVVEAQSKLVIIALHGPFGEDGQVQRLLEEAGIPYTGSSSVVSKLTIDKTKTKEVVSAQTPILTPTSKRFSKGHAVTWDETYPVVVKPNGDGSSFGVTIVKSPEALTQAVEEAFKYGSEILLETFVKGRELTCGVIHLEGSPEVLPLVEIRPTEEFFNFDAKYTSSKCEEMCPANLPEKVTKELQELSLQAFKVLGCRHYARVDWILSEDGKPYFLEINTLPGMTKTSLLPKELQAAGIPYNDFVSRLVEVAKKYISHQYAVSL